jgi:hypothetical protein
MGSRQTDEIMGLLQSFAPRFVASNLRGASKAELRQLEALTGVPICATHRAFLLWAGSTPPELFSPFLLEQDFRVSTLIAEAERARAAPQRLPPNVTLFSVAPGPHGPEYLYLCQSADLDEDPTIGYFWEELGSFSRDTSWFTLESYLAYWVIAFRRGQLGAELYFGAHRGKRVDPRQIWPVFRSFGVRRVFPRARGSILGLSRELAVQIDVADGSVAGDDERELLRIGEALREQADSVCDVELGSERMRSRVHPDAMT